MFQALFSAALSEKSACVKKGIEQATPILLKRLEEVASLIRWLTRRALYRINRKVVRALLAHLLQMLPYKGQLLAPIVDNYAKALRILLSYQSHIDHVDPEEFNHILSLSFAAVLGDPVHPNRGLEFDAEVGPSQEDMESEQGEEEEDTRTGKKRSLPPASNPSGARVVRTTSRSPIPLNNGQIEFMLIISMVLQASNIQILPRDNNEIAHIVLIKLRRFFSKYSQWTSAHPHAISATNTILFQLELNSQSILSQFAATMLDPLLTLWSSSGRNSKEGLLLSLKTLLPFATSGSQARPRDLLARLERLLEMEADAKGGFAPLPMESLRLVGGCDDAGPDALRTTLFQSGFNFTPANASSWALLELHADCILEVRGGFL